jgi:DNA repair exonuclease SbcCD ATPase subunit
MNIGLISSIYTGQTTLFGRTGARGSLSLPAAGEKTGSNRVASSSYPAIARLEQQASDTAEAAAIAQEGRDHLSSVRAKVQRLAELAEQYHSVETELTDDEKAELVTEFEETRDALLTELDETEVNDKALFDLSTRYTFRTPGPVSETVTLTAGVDPNAFADLALSDDADADRQAVATAAEQMDTVAVSYEAGASRLDRAASNAEQRLERAEADLEETVDRRQALKLLDSTVSSMVANASYSLLMQANIPGGDAYSLLA